MASPTAERQHKAPQQDNPTPDVQPVRGGVPHGHARSGQYLDQQVHNRSDTQKLDHDGWPASPELPALGVLADHLRQRIVWALAHEPRTPTALARALDASQPLISNHLALVRAAGLVESHPDPHDRRSRVYDIRRESLLRVHVWLGDVQRNWLRRHVGPADPDYYKGHRLDSNFTTRGTPRKRIPRALKEPWER